MIAEIVVAEPDRNDYGHKFNEPYATVALVRTDLRRARGMLRRCVRNAPNDQDLKFAMSWVERALGRIGDGSDNG